MNQAQRKALQAFWNTLGFSLLVVAACLAYAGMLWIGSQIADSITESRGWRFIIFIAVMGVQCGLVVAVGRAWVAYRKEAKR